MTRVHRRAFTGISGDIGWAVAFGRASRLPQWVCIPLLIESARSFLRHDFTNGGWTARGQSAERPRRQIPRPGPRCRGRRLSILRWRLDDGH